MRRATAHARRCVVAALLAFAGVGPLAAREPQAATGSMPKSWRYAFGRRPRPGFISVSAPAAYNDESGFGVIGPPPRFELESACGDGKPFLFAVAVPEGNYDVTVQLGSRDSGSVVTVKAEARRLLLEKVVVPRGKFVTRSFTVNVRYKELHGGGTVRLKPDEENDFDWDHRLTLEFNNSHPCVRSLEITPAACAITLYIAGDSTVTDQRREPWAAWGQMLPRFFTRGVAVANHAESGESLKSFVGKNRWPKLLETLRRGDYLFIQFAHNDQKPGSSHVAPFTTYQDYLRQWIDEARRRGAIPVLVTSMHRRKFDDAGKIVNTLDDYPEAMRRLAKQENVALIDLNAMSKTLFEALGPEGTLKAFVHYPAGAFPGQDKALADDTHFNSYGAYELARCLVDGIRANHLAIAKFLVKDVGPFNPAQPDAVEAWNLPASPQATGMKPEGN